MGKFHFGPHGKNEKRKEGKLFLTYKELFHINMAMGHIVCGGQFLTLKIIFWA